MNHDERRLHIAIWDWIQRAGVVTTIVYKIEAVETFLRSVGMPLRATLGGRAA